MTSPDELVDRLRATGCVFAEDEAQLLRGAARDEAELQRLVGDRVAGLPLEHLLGQVEFGGRKLAVAPGVFVPRRRTEFLADRALQAAGRAGPRPVLVELCCGAAAVAAVLAAAAPSAEVHAADIDPAALACARENLPGGRVHQGDLYAALPPVLRGRVDVLAVNAPYVPTDHIASMPPEAREHEPLHALDGGPDGLDVQRRVAAEAAEWLSPRGVLLVETGRRQAPLTAEVFAEHGLTPRVHRDEQRSGTVVSGTTGHALLQP